MSPPPAEHLAARIFMGPVLRTQPDRRLVDLVRDGYDAAFEEIVRRYRRPLNRFAAAIVGGRSEDVTQDAFSKALPALRGSEAEIELRPWLYRIVRNTALNDLRGHAQATEELSETLPGGRSAAAEAEAREDLRDLMERLRALPEPQRAALVMRELEGLSHEEIAAALGVSGGAARQAIYRARATLREGLGLLLPLPVLRTLADHGGEMAAGGLGAGALKAGMATVLIAGTVGAGVAIQHHHRDPAAPEAAEAAPLAGAEHLGGRGGNEPSASSAATATADSGRDGGGEPDGSRHSGGSLAEGDRSGPGPSPSSTSGDRHGGRSGSDDDGGSSSGSGSDEDGGSSGSSGGDDRPSESNDFSSESSSSGPGDGEAEQGTTTAAEPATSEDGGGSSSGSGSGGGGEDLGTSGTSELDGSP